MPVFTLIHMKRVTGIGGIFFKADDPEKLKSWYAEHLQLDTDQYGVMFKSRNLDNPDEVTYLQWGLFKKDTDYFNPSEKPYMINYCVQNLEEIVEEFKKSGVEVVDEIATYDYGKFVHVMDPEGNKIELWEPANPDF